MWQWYAGVVHQSSGGSFSFMRKVICLVEKGLLEIKDKKFLFIELRIENS